MACPFKRDLKGQREIYDTDTGRDPVKTEAKTGVMQPQAKGYPGPPEAGTGQGGPSPGAFRGNIALQTT